MFSTLDRKLPNVKPCPFCGKPPTISITMGKVHIFCNTKTCVRPSTWLSHPTTNLRDLITFWNMEP